LIGGEFLKGAIVFLAAFLLFLVITLGYADLPPGKMIYNAVVDVETDYPVLGIGASTLVAAVFNGVVYGVIIWLIYSIAERVMKKPQKAQVEVKPAAPS
jgi:hypothetical protein